MGEQFCQQVLASALGELIGGGFVALIVALIGVGVAFYVGDRLGVRQWAKEGREERRREAETALKYVELLQGEIEKLMDWIPEQRKELRDSSAAKMVPIVAPIWGVVRVGGEFARVADTDLVILTAQFYGALENARYLLGVMVETSLITQLHLASRDQHRARAWAKVEAEQHMELAEEWGQDLLLRYDSEKTRLARLVGTAGDGDGDTTRRG